ncbi:MAG: hypothetical protein Q8O92_02440 [Candidatus Latescibacter sp.]|nr:hypothetical protein [Candidatus Latescibacter sp.]
MSFPVNSKEEIVARIFFGARSQISEFGVKSIGLLSALIYIILTFQTISASAQGLESQRHDVKQLDKTEYVQTYTNFTGLAKPALSQQDSLHIFNPFIQPNDSTLVAYGSGDANKDNKIDIEDYKTIQLMLGKKTTDPQLEELMQKTGQNVDYTTNETPRRKQRGILLGLFFSNAASGGEFNP